MEPRNKEINCSVENESKDTTQEVIGENTPVNESEVCIETKRVPMLKRFFRCGIFTKGFTAVIVTFLCSAAVYTLSRFIPAFAEFWTRYPAQGIRFVLAKLTGWFPFSLAECLIVSLPVIAVGYIVASSVSTRRDESSKNFFRWLRPLVSVVLVVLTLFFAAFGPAYGRYKLADNLGLEQKAVSADELYETGKTVCLSIGEEIDNIKFDVSGASVMPYDYRTLVEKVNEAFDKYAADADYIGHFSSNPKPIALSEPMTYTHISGVYTFMTGESNINTNYPDFLIPFTMAHEMAHQRGIAREDEANFVAFLVCIGSGDDYIRYCGYANMQNYLLSALASADVEKYKDLFLNYMPSELAKEFVAYSDFFDKYRDSVASEVTGTVNNSFLQSQGQSAGTKSYGLVVDLAVAYYSKHN